MDFAACPDEVKVARDFLLGKTVVFDTLENALSFFKSDRYVKGLRITTLSGELVTPRGIITGGSPSKRTAVHLGRERELLLAEEEAGKAKAGVTAASEALSTVKKALAEAESEISRAMKEKHERDLLLAKATHELDTLRDGFSSQKEELSLIRQSSSARSRELEDIGRSKESSRAKAEALKKEKASLESSLKSFMDEAASAAQARESVSHEATELRVDVLRLSHDLKALEEETAILQENIDRINGTLKAKAELDLEGKLSSSRQIISGLRDTLPQLASERESLESALKSKKEEKLRLSNEIEEFEGRIRGAEELERTLREKLSREEVAQGKIEAEMGVLSQTVTEEYALSIEEIIASPYDVPNQSKAKDEVRSLKEGIRTLGDVNLLAIEEFERSKERLSFIESQYADLTAARESLRSLVIQLDEKAREAFRQTISIVSENFSKIFADLFEGGEAKIMLIEGQDILDAGIEIVARPSGKKWLSLEALSGGERALTAIAILFSLLKTHPSPFCFLDEVDAALDDLNTVRFGKMLKSFSVDTQMVVITHSKRTMAVADILYGVTMEEPGISKLVSMKLAEVA